MINKNENVYNFFNKNLLIPLVFLYCFLYPKLTNFTQLTLKCLLSKHDYSFVYFVHYYIVLGPKTEFLKFHVIVVNLKEKKHNFYTTPSTDVS